MAKIKVNETEITVVANNQNDYISLTDIARYKSDDPTAVIASWMRNRNTIEVGSINSIFYFLHKTAEPFNCLEQDNLA